MKPVEVGAYEAKTHLSKLLEQVRQGKSFYITKRGRRLAELRPVAAATGRPQFGCDKGRISVGEDFDDPVPDMAEYER